jgi:UDP-N-acetylglucosamine 1-carboxyvinyltransferase
MSTLIVHGGRPLAGNIKAGGSKNAAFPVLAATLLSSAPVTVSNVPNIRDINDTLQILEALGARVERTNDVVRVDPTGVEAYRVPYELGSKIRGSYYFLGPLLGRFGVAQIPFPGGCSVGERPIDQHLRVMEALGAQVSVDSRFITVSCEHLKGADYSFPFPSRGGTINLLLAALNAEGETVIRNANYSPEARCLINFVKHMGGRVTVEPHSDYHATLTVEGKAALAGREFKVISDKIEAATLLLGGLITEGDVRVEDVELEHIQPFLHKLGEIGIEVISEGNSVSTRLNGEKFHPVDVISGLVAPSIDADWEPILAAFLAAHVKGASTIEDGINSERHSRFLPQFADFGCSVEVTNHTRAVIYGGRQIVPAKVTCKEIRGGAALLLLALRAEGRSELANAEQIDRGYEQLEQKLVKLGADIQRIV